MTTAGEPPRDLADRIIRQTLPRPPHLRAFLREAVPNLADGFDCDRARLVDREIILPDWRRRTADLPFEVPYRIADGELPALVYVLVEHQSDTDPLMPLRMLHCAVSYWERQWGAWEGQGRPRPPLRLQPALPIVLYTGATPWGSNRALADLLGEPTAFHAFAPTWRPLFWNLSERTPRALLDSGEAWLQLMAVMRAAGAEPGEFQAVYAEALRRLQAVFEQDPVRWEELANAVMTWGQWRRPLSEREALKAIGAASQTNPVLQNRVKAMVQTIAEALIEEGRAEGRAEGQLIANRKTLRRLLTLRFGPLPETLSRRIDAASDEALLENAIAQVLDMKSLDELTL